MSRWPQAGVVLLGLAMFLFAQTKSPQTKASSAALARGKYLVEKVGMCQDCHSPRDQQGQFVQDKWMQGMPTPFKPLAPMPEFAEYAPPIAGLPGWSEAEVVKFMMTGLGPSGAKARPPMPQYRFDRDDATSVAKYLKSLPTAEKSSK